MNHLRTLNRLLLYRNILDDKLLIEMMTVESRSGEYATAAKLIERAEQVGLQGDLVREYIFYLLANSDNILSRTAEQSGAKVGGGLLTAAEHDIVVLREFLQQDMNSFSEEIMHSYKPTTTVKNRAIDDIKKFFIDDAIYLSDAAKGLCEHYKRYGYGLLANHMAFKWDEKENSLVGISSCDDITFDRIIGYDRQKEELINNTKAFLQGLPANNVLLYGQRGTGKSSSIKALVNTFFADGLRLVQISRYQFMHLPAIMGALKNWGKKFILCLDDLSFEEFEVEYKQLKSILDGGLEARPDNVLIYATSNRRNIIKEVWADNEGDELHRTDTINEKVSLSDRFGLKIFFISPNQEEYFTIVKELAARYKLGLSDEELRQESVKWEMTHTGRSGRVAEQLVTYLAGRGKQ